VACIAVAAVQMWRASAQYLAVTPTAWYAFRTFFLFVVSARIADISAVSCHRVWSAA